MDDWTLQKLKEWEVPENIISNFRGKYMSTIYIKSIYDTNNFPKNK